MKVYAEQFDLPHVFSGQLEMQFMDVPFSPFGAFSWWAVLDLEVRSRRYARPVRGYHVGFRRKLVKRFLARS